MKKRTSLWMLVILILGTSWARAGEDLQRESAVLFHTACARCHEGECSGRLSFSLPQAAAEQHMRRFGGELLPEHLGYLFDLLRHTKENCRFFDFGDALISDRAWAGDKLDRFREASGRAYFLPLGRLTPGSYRLAFEGPAAGESGIRVEVLDELFDQVHDGGLESGRERAVLAFSVEGASKLFLRITALRPMKFDRIELAGGP